MSFKEAKLALVLLWTAPAPELHSQIHALGYDTPAYLDFEFSAITVAENAPAAVVNIYRTGDFRQYTRVDFATEGGTATENSDYKPTGGTLTFAPGEGMKRITVPLIADDETEADESFRIVLSNPSANTLLLRDTILITIKDASGLTAPKLQVSSSQAGEITLSWEGQPGYVLERTAHADALSWEPVPCTPTVAGTHCEVTEKTGSALYLYRLRTP